MISIASVNSTRGISTGTLHCPGLLVPLTAICDSDAAPAQYHSRRAPVSTHSLPSRDSSVPANTPAEYVRTMTYRFSAAFFAAIAILRGLLRPDPSLRSADPAVVVLRRAGQLASLGACSTRGSIGQLCLGVKT